MKRSAGILVYKYEDNKIKVLLSHFGGPYWQGVDKGGWSIPKGEMENVEKAIDAAKREFNEETNLKISTNLDFLASRKVSNNKLVIMFYTNSDFDLKECKSNNFEMEFPKGSGKKCTFPEMDKYEWMDLNKAKEMIIESQLYFLDRLEENLNNLHM
ncbi:MAG: NUDIX domain-containing protein [Bacilli bacterium]|nr:NUDIX domain-containing protein [Bacilli bacterium]